MVGPGPKVSLDGTAGCRAPGSPGALGRQPSAFASIPLPSPSAPVWLVHPLGSSTAHSRKSEETFFLFGYDGVAWLETTLSLKNNIPCIIFLLFVFIF